MVPSFLAAAAAAGDVKLSMGHLSLLYRKFVDCISVLLFRRISLKPFCGIPHLVKLGWAGLVGMGSVSAAKECVDFFTALYIDCCEIQAKIILSLNNKNGLCMPVAY